MSILKSASKLDKNNFENVSKLAYTVSAMAEGSSMEAVV